MTSHTSSKKTTNVGNLSFLIMCWTLEISFTASVRLNGFIFILAVLLLGVRKKWGGLVALFLIPLLPAMATYWSVLLRGSGGYFGLVLFSRTFAFAALGLIVTYGLDLEELLRYLEQKRLPANFVYGLLVVINGIPNIKREVVALSEASLLRGKTLHFWSPLFYLKTIVVAFAWRDHYTEAMASRGYDEVGTRTHYQQYVNSPWGAITGVLLFTLSNLLAYA